MTPLLRRLHKLAKRHHLTCALGRALACVSRHYNEGRMLGELRYGYGDPDDLTMMRRMSVARAKRWLTHWSRGGSLKSLRRTREQFNKRRREDHARRREVSQIMKDRQALSKIG